MSRLCKAPGCGARTKTFGRYCNRHHSHFRRHGAADQQAITVAELKPFRRLVKACIERNAENPLWANSEANWRAVVNHARGILARFQRGRAGFRFERLAAEEVIRLAENVEPREVCEMVWAVYLLEDNDPHRFRSNDAFRTQLVRRVRGLTRTNAGQWKDTATGRVKMAYRELSPKVAATMAGWIVQALGGVGVVLARLERNQREEKQRRTEVMAEAVRTLI